MYLIKASFIFNVSSKTLIKICILFFLQKNTTGKKELAKQRAATGSKNITSFFKKK